VKEHKPRMGNESSHSDSPDGATKPAADLDDVTQELPVKPPLMSSQPKTNPKVEPAKPVPQKPPYNGPIAAPLPGTAPHRPNKPGFEITRHDPGAGGPSDAMKDLEQKIRAQQEARQKKIEEGRLREAQRQERGGRYNIFVDERPLDLNRR